MRKSTKLLSLLLAVLLTVSCFSILSAVPVSAAEGEQKIYFDFPTDGTWGDPGAVKVYSSGIASFYCHVYAVYGNETELVSTTFGSKSERCMAEGNNVYSFDLSQLGTIEEGADYAVIFATATALGYQTCDITFTSDCIGDHVYITPFEGEATRENAMDSHKVDYYAAWRNNSQCGPKASISSLGQMMPGVFPFYQPKAQQLSNCLRSYLTNPVNNGYFQYDNNMVLCDGLGVTPQEVYDQYMADNADFIEAYGDDVQTNGDIPCPFITDGTTRIAAPAYVAEVLGLQGEEPTTEPPYADVTDPDTGVTVTINNPNAVLTVDAVTSGDDYDGAAALLAADGKQIVTMYDIDLTDNGAEYQPAEPVAVKIPSDTEDGTVYRYADGALTDMNAVYADGAYDFDADHFSYYLIANDAPIPAEDYSIIGSSDVVFGGVWWVENPDSAMTYDPADGLYKKTYTDVAAQDMLQLKVIKDHDEYQCWPATGGNYTFNVNSDGDITVTFDPATGEINVLGDITVVTSIDITSMIAAGNGEDTYLNGANWDPCDPANAMTEVEPGLWEITMEDIYAFDNYNIKFAANSIDEDGNPVSNPWGINWGTEREALYPTGEPIPAVYNGKNCIFEVEEDESTVIVQLDLRNFDYSTKEGALITITVIPPEPVHVHTPGAAAQENVVPASCTQAGSYDEVVRCTECNEVLSSTPKTIEALGHAPGAATQENVVPATCTQEGSYDEVVKCTRCGEVISSTHKTIPVIAHTPGTAAQENVVPATCTQGGSYDEVVRCTVCGNVVSSTHKTTDALGHTPGTATQENYVAATCTQGGSYDEVVRCTVCGEVVSTTHKTTSALGHSLKYVAKVAATEEADGVKAHYECTRCHALFLDSAGQEPTTAEELVIPKLEPEPEPTTAEPTTVEPTTQEPTEPPVPGDTFTVNAVSNLFTTGSKTYTDIDGDGLPDTVTITYYADVEGLRLQAIQFAVLYDPNVLSFDPAKNGEYDEDLEEYDYAQMFPVTLGSGDVTYVREGRLKFAAANYQGYALKKNGKLVPVAKVVFDIADGASGTTDVNMQFGVLAFVNGKTEDEYIVYSDAAGLDQNSYDYINSLAVGNYGALFSVVDHVAVVDKGYDATCTETGLTDGSHCEICGEIIVPQEVIPAKGHTAVTDPAVPATCTETGLTEGSHCSVCNEVIVAQQVVPAKGHTVVIDPAVPATCTETGLTQGSHCSVCDEVLVAQETVPATGHTSVTDPAVAPTCTQTGLTEGSHCSVCNEVLVAQQVVPATGHTAVTDPAVAPTCTQTGLTEGSHCSVCHEVLVAQQVVPAKGHTSVTDPAVAPTCTETGLTEGSHCSVCNEVLVAQQTVPAKGHTEVIDPAVPATCTETGLTQGSHCSVCNEVLVAQTVVSALGHLERNVPGTPATYTATGLTDGVYCDRCNEWVVPQEVIPKLVPAHMIGDVNRDGNVDVLDAIVIQKYAADKETLDDEQKYIGDVNDDGEVNVLDAVLIQKYAGEKIDSFPKKA